MLIPNHTRPRSADRGSERPSSVSRAKRRGSPRWARRDRGRRRVYQRAAMSMATSAPSTSSEPTTMRSTQPWSVTSGRLTSRNVTSARMSKPRSRMTVASPRPPENAPRETHRARRRSPTRPGRTLLTATPATTISTKRRCPRLVPTIRRHRLAWSQYTPPMQATAPASGTSLTSLSVLHTAPRSAPRIAKNRKTRETGIPIAAATARERLRPVPGRSESAFGRAVRTTVESGTTVTFEEWSDTMGPASGEGRNRH